MFCLVHEDQGKQNHQENATQDEGREGGTTSSGVFRRVGVNGGVGHDLLKRDWVRCIDIILTVHLIECICKEIRITYC